MGPARIPRCWLTWMPSWMPSTPPRPAHPLLMSVIREPDWAGRGGVLGIHEGIHVSQQRGILAVPIGTLLSIYDIAADCRHPRLISSVDIGTTADPLRNDPFMPGGIHSG